MKIRMKRNNLCIGILADVDAGKTTLSERILFECNVIKTLGRVDSGSAFLDTDALEKQRGITIFTKEAVFTYGGKRFTLVDTPGHADFAAEAKRAFSVLDAAILVISGTDGVTRRAADIFRALSDSGIPIFIFINKTDLPLFSEEKVINDISALTQKAVFFLHGEKPSDDDMALTSEDALSIFEQNGSFTDDDLAGLVMRGSLVPCYFGSALKGEGVRELLNGISRYTVREDLSDEFAARVFKISYDDEGTRLTHIKVLGGTLAVRDIVKGEKIVSLRTYSGSRFLSPERVPAGEICSAAGLKKTYAGEGLGSCADIAPPQAADYLTYRVLLPEGVNELSAYDEIRRLGEEAPELDVRYDSEKKEIRIGIMGDVHRQTIESLIERRTGLSVSFDSPSVVYKETITRKAEGIGHFEPLRHYAEVHLLLEPLEDDSRNIIAADVKAGNISLERQQTVLSTLASSELRGVLTGAELTGVKITLAAGQENVEHTESGDFREAALRALRQGLMKAEPVVLEPFCSYSVTAPKEMIGRISSDITRAGGSVKEQYSENDMGVVKGEAALSFLRPYASDLPVISSGRAEIDMELCGYRPCADQAAVIEASGYDPLRDTEFPCGSVFCRSGAAVTVPWDEVSEYCHIEPVYRKGAREENERKERGSGLRSEVSSDISLEEIESILKLVSRSNDADARKRKYPKVVTGIKPASAKSNRRPSGPEKFVVDGYNLIFAWKDLREIAEVNIGAARDKLIEVLANYASFKGIEMTVVFDAYRNTSMGPREDSVYGITVVFTGENQTADSWIEKFAFDHGKTERISVVTSDRLEQINVFGSGAARIGSHEFTEMIEEAAEEIRNLI